MLKSAQRVFKAIQRVYMIAEGWGRIEMEGK
jgi:hypothetical protein